MSNEGGVLYVVATPLGNLGDITARALAVLGEVELIASEDTRRTGTLLRHFGITTPLFALHEHNERQVTEQLLGRLREGQRLALVSDAGTPLLSDPGFHLVRAAHDIGITVSPVPGPSAVTAALSAAGLPTDRFVFEGFLPSRKGARRERLQALAGEPRTLVFFEAPHRIVETLSDMAQAFGAERLATVARELTKTFETVRRAPLAELARWVAADPDQQRGELVLVVEGAPARAEALDENARHVIEVLAEALPPAQAAALAARITGLRKNLLYDHAVQSRNRPEEE